MTVSFLKRGKSAREELRKEESRVEESRKNNVRRFWMPEGKDGKITFLDGNLDADGLLDIPMLYEHQLRLNGHWRNWFVCVRETEPCPICESGDSPYFAGVMTVIDHSEYKDKQGAIHKDEVRLYVVKRDAIKILQKQAAKRGGLAGCTFEVSRVGDKSPNTGNMFEFVEKSPIAKVLKQYKVQPFDYEKALTYKSADELREMGFASMTSVPAGGGGAPMDDDEDNDPF